MSSPSDADLIALVRRQSRKRIESLRPGQGEAVRYLLGSPSPRLLLVQATGWGKSLVYFATTLYRRAQGCGPTLVLSPLLSLMANQQSAAADLSLQACSITGDTREDWARIEADLASGRVDILFLSPERLARGDFLDRPHASLATGRIAGDRRGALCLGLGT